MAATGTIIDGAQYKGASNACPDVIPKRIELISAGYQGQAGFFGDGTQRPLAVTSAARLEVLPDVPALSELGIEVESQARLGILAPAGTPEVVPVELSDASKLASGDAGDRAELAAEGAIGPGAIRPCAGAKADRQTGRCRAPGDWARHCLGRMLGAERILAQSAKAPKRPTNRCR